MGMERPYPCCHANCSASLPFHLAGGVEGGGLEGLWRQMDLHSSLLSPLGLPSDLVQVTQPLLPTVPSSGMETGPLLSSAAPLAPQLGHSETLVRNLSLCQRKRKRKHETHK